jgi:hypothetical protein
MFFPIISATHHIFFSPIYPCLPLPFAVLLFSYEYSPWVGFGQTPHPPHLLHVLRRTPCLEAA